MIKKAVFFLGFFLASQLFAAPIKKINSIKEILPEATTETLVLFDIDHTLIVPDSALLDSKLRPKEYEMELEKVFSKKKPILKHLLEKASEKCPAKLIDSQAAQCIRELQDKKIVTMALTLRAESNTSDEFNENVLTINQLKALGIDFHSSNHHLKRFKLDGFSEKKSPSYYKGVIFSAGQEKGPILLAFLDRTKIHPKRVVFVDDNPECLVSVFEALSSRNIPCICLHYLGESSLNRAFNPALANLQLFYLLVNDEWLAENKAKEILENCSYSTSSSQ